MRHCFPIVVTLLIRSIAVFILPFACYAQIVTGQIPDDSTTTICEQLFADKKYKQVVTHLAPYPLDSIVPEMYTRHIAHALHVLAESHQALGHQKEAFLYQGRYRKIKDSLLAKERNTFNKIWREKLGLEEKAKTILEQELAMNKRKTSLYQKNMLIWGVAGGGLIIFLLVYFTLKSYEQKRKIIASKEQQIIKNAEIQHLTAIIQSSTEERNKVFQQLQQSLFPQLDSINVTINRLKKRHHTHNSDDFEEVNQNVTAITHELKSIFRTVYTPDSSKQSLKSNIDTFLSQLPDSKHITFNYEGEDVSLSHFANHHIFRIVQEFIHNTLKHATKGTTTEITLTSAKDVIELKLSNNRMASYINETLAPATNQGLGLESIKQRVDSMNGTIHIEKEKHFLIDIRIPVS